MRVIVNGLLALRRRTGIGCYVGNLVPALRELAGPDAVHSFPAGWLRQLARGLGAVRPGGAAPAGGASSLRGVARGLAQRAWQRAFTRACRRGRYDLYHEPNYIPLPTDLPAVATVHDLSIVLHPQWHPADRVAFHERHFEPGLRRCRHVLTDAECVRAEVIREFGLPPDRVTAVPLGIGPEFRPMTADECRPALRDLNLPPDYLLHVGTIEPRKNLLTLMRAYCALAAELRDRCPLVLVGGWGWQVADAFDYFHATARHRNVRHVGYVESAALPALYSAARALVFPSHYEGFGLPPLEMLACGGAVIASTAAAVREVIGDRGCLVHAADVEGWTRALERVIRDADWRAELRRGATERARPFTWRRCAERTLAVYRSVLEPAVRRAA